MMRYLESSEYIDWHEPSIKDKASALANGQSSGVDVVRSCFSFVRDEIKHSLDFQLNPVTLKASDVLKHGTGYCYAKSHLLAALLRANNIPTALCYQRLTFIGDQPPFCLHGLNSVYLDDFGWLRLDARGNKDGVHADFLPPKEILAFDTNIEGELDYDQLFASPAIEVINVLSEHSDFRAVAENLPDSIDLNKQV